MHASTLKSYTHQIYILLLAVKDIFLRLKTVKGAYAFNTLGGIWLGGKIILQKGGNGENQILKQTGACEVHFLHIWTRLQRKG